jgi:hypothetical protein
MLFLLSALALAAPKGETGTMSAVTPSGLPTPDPAVTRQYLKVLQVWARGLPEGASNGATALRAAGLPVLLPPLNAVWVSPPVFGGAKGWYSLSASAQGYSYALQASGNSWTYTKPPVAKPTATVRGVPAVVTRSEGIVSVSWIEMGVAWALDIECEDEADTRCADATFATEQAAALVYVGAP